MILFADIFVKAKAKFGQVDLLVNNAGVGFEDKDNWEKTIDINFVSTYLFKLFLLGIGK